MCVNRSPCLEQVLPADGVAAGRRPDHRVRECFLHQQLPRSGLRPDRPEESGARPAVRLARPAGVGRGGLRGVGPREGK